MKHPIIERSIVIKAFPNTMKGWYMAKLYAKKNNYEMLTTADAFRQLAKFHQQHMRSRPSFYYFTFMTD